MSEGVSSMDMSVVIGSASDELGGRVCAALGTQPAQCLRGEFPDGELQPVVCTPVRGHDVYVVQSTSPPVERNLLELLFLVDACRRAGACRVTAVIPYFGYARQDRRTAPGAPLGAAVVGGALHAVGVDRIVAVDPHVAALEAIVGVPLERVSAVAAVATALGTDGGPERVVVAPDFGAVKLAQHYARLLGTSTAVVSKERISGTAVRAREVIGDVRGKVPVIVDDMISTAGTVVEAAQALRAAGAASELVVAATHGLFTGPALRRLDELEPDLLLTTDTVAAARTEPARVRRVSVAEQLAGVVRALHDGKPLLELAAYD
jgi:ribose-phosphate pyrophosphokinase